MKRCFFIIVIGLVLSCKKSTTSEDDSSNGGGGSTTTQPGGAESDHKSSGKDCKDTTGTSEINFSGYTFYVDSGYVVTGNGIVAAIKGSPQIQFLDGYYRIIQDSSSYFPSYLSQNNTYRVSGDTLEFNSYTQYIIKSYILCQKTLVYDMTEFGWNNLNNRLVLYRNL